MQNNLCSDCVHYLGKTKCDAFSNGIPDEILLGFNDHSKPLPDQDNDIVFEPKEKRNEFIITE